MYHNIERSLLRMAAGAALLLLTLGCGGRIPEQSWAQQLYLPYVASVEIPESVQAGVPFPITLRLTTAVGPDLATEAGLSVGVGALYIYLSNLAASGAAHEGPVLQPYILDNMHGRPIESTPPGADYTMQWEFNSPGMHYLHIATVKQQDAGGLVKEYNFHVDSPVLKLDPALFDYREYAIEVLP